MSKRILYLDLDDTVLDTENYLKQMIGGKWRNWDKSTIYEQLDSMTLREAFTFMGIMTNYSSIPFIDGALEGIKKLQEVYDIIFVTSVATSGEEYAKELFFHKMGWKYVICKGTNWRKNEIDMSHGDFVDNNTINLNLSKAELKIAFYQKYSTREEYTGPVVHTWFELMEMLNIGGIENGK